MAYKITITQSNPNGNTTQFTITDRQLISALINEFDYDIYVDGIEATVSGDSLDIHSADADIDDLEASMHDAVVNALYGLIKHHECMQK
jgi:hypothetical protein